jgi:hypothetical protein
MTNNVESISHSPLKELFSGGLEEAPVSLTPLIQQKLSQPGTPVTEILRLLQLEQVAILERLQWAAEEPALHSSVPALACYRDHLAKLHKFLLENESQLAGDVLNWDGPRFRYAFREFADLGREALIAMGVSPQRAAEIKQTMDEAWEKQLPQIREKVKQMDENP